MNIKFALSCVLLTCCSFANEPDRVNPDESYHERYIKCMGVVTPDDDDMQFARYWYVGANFPALLDKHARFKRNAMLWLSDDKISPEKMMLQDVAKLYYCDPKHDIPAERNRDEIPYEYRRLSVHGFNDIDITRAIVKVATSNFYEFNVEKLIGPLTLVNEYCLDNIAKASLDGYVLKGFSMGILRDSIDLLKSDDIFDYKQSVVDFLYEVRDRCYLYSPEIITEYSHNIVTKDALYKFEDVVESKTYSAEERDEIYKTVNSKLRKAFLSLKKSILPLTSPTKKVATFKNKFICAAEVLISTTGSLDPLRLSTDPISFIVSVIRGLSDVFKSVALSLDDCKTSDDIGLMVKSVDAMISKKNQKQKG